MKVLVLPTGLLATCLFLTITAAGQESPSRPKPVAIARERIEANLQEIRVFRGEEAVQPPYFLELLVVTPVEPETTLDRLLSKQVTVVRSIGQRDRWEIHTEVIWRLDFLTLPNNVFKVKQVLHSTRERPIEVHVNGEKHQLKPGEILLVLG